MHKYTGREHTGDKSEHDAEREYWAKKKRAKLAEDRKQELERQKKIEADRVAHQKAMEAERERKAERKKQKRAKKEARKAKKKKKRKKKRKKKKKKIINRSLLSSGPRGLLILHSKKKKK